MSWRIPPDYVFLDSLEPFCILTKPRSKYLTEYYEDPEEPWFIYVCIRVRKTHQRYRVSMIIRKDVPTWIRAAQSMEGCIIAKPLPEDFLSNDTEESKDH